MIQGRKAGVLLGVGFMLVMLGAMPLTAYVGFILRPAECYHNAFNGTVPHLLLGLIPWATGIVLIVLGAEKAKLVLIVASVGLSIGLVLSSVSLIGVKRGDPNGFLWWLAFPALGMIVAAAARKIIALGGKGSGIPST